MKKLKILVRIAIVTAIVPTLVFLGDSDFLVLLQNKWEIIPLSWDIDVVKLIFYGIGTFATIIFLSIPLGYYEFRYRSVTEQVMSLVKYNKDNLIDLLHRTGYIKHKNINIRIFVPNIKILQRIKRYLNKRFGFKFKVHMSMSIKNYIGLADKDKTEGLSFKVSPPEVAEGIVGECYNTKYFIIEDDLKVPEKKRKLTKYQDSRTSQLSFCMCYPIIDKDTDEVTAIVAFDSEFEVKIDENQKGEWAEIVAKYCHTLYDYNPELFR